MLKEKILARIQTQKSDFVALYDKLMAEYGYIPLEEFKKLPMQLVCDLIDVAFERHEKERKAKPRRG